MNIHDLMEEKVGIALIYADDGAFHTAAGILKELAETIEAHATKCDEKLAKHMAEAETS